MNIDIKSVSGFDSDKEVLLVTLRNKNSMSVSFLNFGGALTSIKLNLNTSNEIEVLAGYKNLLLYKQNPYFLGALIGRVANRIKNSQITFGEKTYQLDPNFLDKHTLHGGGLNFSNYLWNIESDGKDKVRLTCEVPHLSDGFPGNLTGFVDYSLSDENELLIEYEFSTDQETLLNVTSHPYFNLDGMNSENILNHKLKINSQKFLVNDSDSINTGEIKDVSDTPYDFREFREIGERIFNQDVMLDQANGGYDLCYVLERGEPAAEIFSENSNLKLTVETSQPGLQLYTSNNFIMKGERNDLDNHHQFRKHSFFCLETQHFPGAEMHPHFPSIVLQPDQKYKHFCSYAFSTLS